MVGVGTPNARRHRQDPVRRVVVSSGARRARQGIRARYPADERL
nr:J563 [uncultured bacterium]